MNHAASTLGALSDDDMKAINGGGDTPIMDWFSGFAQEHPIEAFVIAVPAAPLLIAVNEIQTVGGIIADWWYGR